MGPNGGERLRDGHVAAGSHISTPEPLASVPLRFLGAEAQSSGGGQAGQDGVRATVGFVHLSPQPTLARSAVLNSAPLGTGGVHLGTQPTPSSPASKLLLARGTSFVQRGSTSSTQQWPPTRDQLTNFLSNMLTSSPEVSMWYDNTLGGNAAWPGGTGSYQSDIENKRNKILSMQLPFEQHQAGEPADRAKFAIVKDPGAAKGEPDSLYNVHLLRFFVEQEWKLERPDVIISVTGGAGEFNFPSMHKDMIMRGEIFCNAPCDKPAKF
jgi:hypothetical protein